MLSRMQEIQQEKIGNAKDFLRRMNAYMCNANPLEQIEILRDFIELKCNPEIAKEIIQNDSHLEAFRRYGDDAEELKLYTLATRQPYPEAYAEAVRSLILLYQRESKQPIALNVMYKLLLIPEFRCAFKKDAQLPPFFMAGFYDALSNYVKLHCQDGDLAQQLVVLLKESAQKQPSSAMIDAELMRALEYAHPLSPEQEDIITIHKFLAAVSNESPAVKQMAKLELALQKRAGSRYNSETKSLEGYKEGELFKHHKLLTGFLREWAQEKGFAGYIKLKAVLMPDEFFSMLALGGIFKDNQYQGDFHGDFTHLIQAFLIEEWNCEDSQKPKLKCQFRHLYEWIGKNERYVEWMRTFEFPLGSLYKPTAVDFRATVVTPGINHYLNSSECPFPVLHQLNKGRSVKEHKYRKADEGLEFEEFKPEGRSISH